MPVPRTNFRAGDRVRGADWFDEIDGAVGTVLEAVEVRGNDWAAQDLLVRFDRPVVIFDEPQWTFLHSAHNFQYIGDARAAPAIREGTSVVQPKRRRLPYKQPPPLAYRVSVRELPSLRLRLHLRGSWARRGRGCGAAALRAVLRHVAPFVSSALEMQQASEFPRGVVAAAARA